MPNKVLDIELLVKDNERNKQPEVLLGLFLQELRRVNYMLPEEKDM